MREQLGGRSLIRARSLFREGEPGNHLYVLARGAVSIMIGDARRANSRLVTFAPGSIFGEAAMFDGGLRSANAQSSPRTRSFTACRDRRSTRSPVAYPGARQQAAP